MSNEVIKEVIFKCDLRYPLQAVTKLPPSLIFLSSQDNLDYNPPVQVIEASYGNFGRGQNSYPSSSTSPKPPDQFPRYNQEVRPRAPPGAQRGYTPPSGDQRGGQRGYTPPNGQKRGNTPPGGYRPQTPPPPGGYRPRTPPPPGGFRPRTPPPGGFRPQTPPPQGFRYRTPPPNSNFNSKFRPITPPPYPTRRDRGSSPSNPPKSPSKGRTTPGSSPGRTPSPSHWVNPISHYLDKHDLDLDKLKINKNITFCLKCGKQNHLYGSCFMYKGQLKSTRCRLCKMFHNTSECQQTFLNKSRPILDKKN